MKKNLQKRFIGLEFKLDKVPKDSLRTLKIQYRRNESGWLEVKILTDKGVIPTNAIKGYQRKSRPGFYLKKTYHHSNSGSLEHAAYLDDVDVLYAIDTNTQQVGNEYISVGVACGLQIRVTGQNFGNIEAYVEDLFCSREANPKVENLVWRDFITKLLLNDSAKEGRIGLVVDSDLENLDKYNRRELPIKDDFYLPPNVVLIYASADTQNDSVANSMISFCDQQANSVLRELKTKLVEEFRQAKQILVEQFPTEKETIDTFFRKQGF